MGSFTSLRVDGYSLLSTRSYVDLTSTTLFREDDKRVQPSFATGDGTVVNAPWMRLPDARAAVQYRDDGTAAFMLPESLEWTSERGGETSLGEPDETGESSDGDWEELTMGHAYISNVATVRARLDVMGFTLGAAQAEFKRGVSERLEELASWMKDDSESEYLGREYRVLSELTFPVWLRSFRSIKEQGAHAVAHVGESQETYGGYLLPASDATPTIAYMLEEGAEHTYGFADGDIRYLLRASLEVCDDEALVELDLTEVTSAGYYGYDERVVANAHDALTAAFPANAPTIVLTEGSVDRRAIKGALDQLDPHLADLYAFMDFEGMSMPGGASHLAATIKAFAGVGIANRVIAFFDNDTGARSALRALAALRLPANIRVLTYPPISLGERYPTIGPSGAHEMNVNGTAGSIELYFGEDVLRRPEGTLTPIKWGGFDPAASAYQGELQDKAAVQNRFWEKLAALANDGAVVHTHQWSGMRAILTLLHTAFH